MKLFRKREKEEKKEKFPRILEGIDMLWMEELSGEEYEDQNPHIEIGLSSRIGTRTSQQDAVAVRWICDHLLTAMVCDGMGGLDSGDIASKFVIEYIMSSIESKAEEGLSTEILFDIIRAANQETAALTDENGDPLKCGTTLTMALIRDDLTVWMSVGDSRIYFLSKSGLRCVTKDHNYALMSEMRKEEEGFHANSQIRPDTLVSYLGSPGLRYIDYNTMPWKMNDGDIMMLCSDGLFKLLEDQRIEELLTAGNDDLDALASLLVEEATKNAEEKQDNTTVLLLRYKE